MPPIEASHPSSLPVRGVEGEVQARLSVNGKPKEMLPGATASLELERARGLADAGRLGEAAEICETQLREHGPSAQAYYLLGLVRDAVGDGTALECYRKALYLDPNHYETLLQMALLSQKDGNAARARTFRERARRVKASNRDS